MMRATLDHDLIVSLSEEGDTELGTLPRDVGLERLRWTGTALMDLATLQEMWVLPLGRNVWELHAVEVPGSQLVPMTWADRRHLVTDPDGTIRVLSLDERRASETSRRLAGSKTRLRSALEAEVGDAGDQMADLSKLVYCLILERAGDTEAAALLDDLAPVVAGIYPPDRIRDALIPRTRSIKASLPAYYDHKQQLQENGQ